MMDFTDFLVDIDAFRRGESRPLPMPKSVEMELAINHCFAERRRTWEAENGPNVGYQFPWGQIREDPSEPDGGAGPDRLAMEWHFVLNDVHAEFLRAGGGLGELSDCCVATLERAEACASEESSREVLPPYLVFDEGIALSAFSIQIRGPENLPAAREWIADVFIPGVLPLLVENATRLNAQAGPAAID